MATRRLSLVLKASAIVLGGVALSSCGVPVAQQPSSSAAPPAAEQPNTPQTKPGKPSGSGAQEKKLDRCHTSMLSASFSELDSAMGHTSTDLTLTNKSKQTCTLYGYGGMQLLADNNRQIETQMQRDPNPGPSLIRLAPGESAKTMLVWSTRAASDEPAECQPTPIRVLVTPPDETDPLDVAWGSKGATFGAVCDHGRIQGNAYHR